MKEAKRFGETVEVASSATDNYTHLPHHYEIPSDLDYLHITTNNTIFGTEIRKEIDSPVPLIADMSSDIMSRPVDVSKYTAIYAGAQKTLPWQALQWSLSKTTCWARPHASCQQ